MSAVLLSSTRSLGLFLFCAPLGVIVVQPSGPPGTITDIQTACDMAVERDAILVEQGTYPAFEVVDKWLTIAAESGATVNVLGGIRVRDLGVGKRVTLIGLVAAGSPSGSPGFRNGLHLTANEGRIRATDCQFRAADAWRFGDPGAAGLLVEQSNDVSLSRCSSFGGLAAIGYSGPSSGAGMHLIHSSVSLYDCTARGGDGRDTAAPPWTQDAGEGGHGCHAESTELLASRTTFAGGNGGDAGLLIWGSTSGGAGGHGLLQAGSNSVARLISPTATGGNGGYDGPGPFYAQDGQPWVGAQITILPVAARSMSIAQDPIRESSTVTVTFQGQPGDRIGLVRTPITSSSFNPAWNGQQLFPVGSAFIRAGMIPASGTIDFSLPFSDLGPGVESRTYQLQALFGGTDGYRVLGTPVSLLVLDSAF